MQLEQIHIRRLQPNEAGSERLADLVRHQARQGRVLVGVAAQRFLTVRHDEVHWHRSGDFRGQNQLRAVVRVLCTPASDELLRAPCKLRACGQKPGVSHHCAAA